MKSEMELTERLHRLISAWESEVVEFKQADNTFKTSELGHYFSALANEANLRGIESAWLVFGVNNKTRTVCGTNYKPKPEHLMALKNDVRAGLEPSMTFREIHEIELPEGRVLLFEIPPAPAGMPIGWNGFRYARSGESLCALDIEKEDRIRAQSSKEEWAACIASNATMNDLSPEALLRARQIFSKNNTSRFSEEEIEQWQDMDFLQRLGLLRDNQITNAALLLLGRPESAVLLNPHPAQITWKLESTESAYQHYGPPFLLNTSIIYQRIRNINIRLLPANELIGEDVSKYDQKVVLEGLHNAIAHQDYRQNARVILTEFTDTLSIENEGTFYEGDPSLYIEGHKTPRRYRNTFLVKAMAQLGMIDTMGYGIHRMYRTQAARSFPLPDYNLSDNNAVQLTLYGKVVDPAYTRLLLQNTEIPLNDVMALDRIQKGLPADDHIVARLRKAKWIEGRKPNLHISAEVAAATESKAAYIRTRAQDDTFYEKLIIDYLNQYNRASRAEIDQLLLDKLSDGLTEAQKTNKVRNLLTRLRIEKKIHNVGSRGKPSWALLESNDV